MSRNDYFMNSELQEVDDADDTVYEYGLPSEEESGFIGTLSNLVAPARREVIKAPEEKQVPLEELGMDSIPGETMTVKTPGEYGPVETDFSYAPIVRGAKSVLDYGKKLFSDEKTQEDTVQALKAAPAAAVEGGGKFLEDQMAAAMGMSAGYSSVNRPDGEVARFDPLAFTGAVAPAGIAATSTAKAGETVLGIFGSATGRTATKRFEKYNDEVEKLEKSGKIHKKKDNKDTFLFRKSDGVFLDEEDIPRFEMSTKDVELLPYFKKRNAVAGKENTFKVNPDPQMKSDLMLPDVIKFDELFNEYPQLKSIKVIDMPEGERYENTAAYYASDTNEIAIRSSDEKQFISSLLHEIQHAVDDIELLPGGSSPDMFKGKAKSTEEFFNYLDQQSKYINKRNAFKEKFKRAMSEKLTEQEKEILDDPKEMDKLFLNLAGIDDTPEYISLNNITTGKMERVFNNKYGNLQNKIMDYVNEQDNFEIIEPVLEDVQGFIYDKIKFDYANDQIKKRKYRQTPGEVDARNVSRRFLNPALQKYLPSKTADIEKDFSVNKEIEKYMDAESRQVGNVEYDTIFKNLDELETPEQWQAAAKKLVTEERDITGQSVVRRTPELEQSARDLIDNKLLTREQHLENVAKNKPITEWTSLPRQPSSKAAVFALKPSQREQGLFLLSNKDATKLGVQQTTLKEGDLFNGRLDIPAYQNYDTWVVAGTSPAVKSVDGKGVTTYAKAIHYTSGNGKPVKFIASEKRSQEIGTGREGKTGYATISGRYKATSEEDLRNLADTYLNNPEWSQVGFDPRRLGTFYLRKGTDKYNVGSVVTEADEVIQIGPLVLAKNVKIDPSYEGYNKGGLMARR